MRPVYIWRVLIHPGAVSLQEIRTAETLVSLEEAANLMPDGAYTTLRTYNHKEALRLEDHFLRLEETGRLVGCPLQLGRDSLRQALRLAIQVYPADQDVRLRLLIDLAEQPGAAWIAAERLLPLSADAYTQGVKTVTCSFVRQNPKAKLSKTMLGASDLRQGLPADVNEALMLDSQGRFLEGLSSNFYIIRDGRLWTAQEGVLPGLTRQLVLDEARLAGLPLELAGYPLTDLPQAQEAFLTSASRAVLPVRQVDALLIGTGQPGPLTHLLAERYAARINLELEEL